MPEQPVICTRCGSEARVVLEDSQPTMVVCPDCEQSESYSEFQRSVGQQMTNHAADVIGKGLKKHTRGNKYVSFEPGRRSRHTPKFRVAIR